MKIFEFNSSRGSLIDQVSKIIGINDGVLIKRTAKGRSGWFSSGTALDTFGSKVGVKTLALIINPSGNGDILLDDGAAKLSIVAGNISGTGLTECYINNSDTNAIVFNTWSLVIAEFSGGINFSTDFEIDPTMTLFLAMVKADDTILETVEREIFYQDFLNFQNIEVDTVMNRDTTVGNFDGISNYIDTEDPFQEIFQNSFSISLWISPGEGNPSANDFIFGSRDASPENRVEAQVKTDGTIRFSYEAGDNSVVLTSNFAFSPGQQPWYQLIFVADTTIGGVGGLKLYVNGSQDDNLGNTATVIFNEYINANALFLSALNNGISMVGQALVKIGDVRVHNKALSSDDAAQLYTSGELLGSEISQWLLNEGGGLTAYDSIGSNHGSWNGTNYYIQSRINAVLNIDLTNFNADDQIKTGQIGDFGIVSGSFQCLEDSIGKYIECVTDGFLEFRGLDLSEFIGNGFIKRFDGDLSSDVGDTVNAASKISFADNIITIGELLSGQIIRNLTIARDAN